MPYQPLSIGLDDFKKLRQQNYYYVDKTLFIKELIDKKGEVNYSLDLGDSERH